MRLLLLLLFVGLPCLSLADSTASRFANKIEKCSVGSLSESSACLDNLYTQRNKQMNVLYQALLSSLELPAPLKDAQTTWLKFRAQTCEYETSGIDKVGGLFYYMQSKCLLVATDKRIAEINQYLACKTSPCPGRTSKN